MKKLLIIVLSLLSLSGCSVILSSNKAADQEIINNIVKPSVSKEYVDEHLGTPMKFTQNNDGTYIAVYGVPYDSNAKNRAILHAIMDIGSVYIWEIIGTVMETAENSNYLVVVYDKNLLVKQ